MFRCHRLNVQTSQSVLVDIDFEIKHSLALVGQSGSGKSLTLKALLGLLPSSLFCDIEYEASFDLVRGESVTLVPQNPFSSLSPMSKIKQQFFVPKALAIEYLQKVSLDESVMQKYPSELSGGEIQRVVIAMALVKRPKLLLLDEPTTSLDSHTKKVIIELIKTLSQSEGFVFLFVTHDIDVAYALCEDIVVIYKGKVKERGVCKEVIASPKDAYTKMLIEANFKHRGFRA